MLGPSERPTSPGESSGTTDQRSIPMSPHAAAPHAAGRVGPGPARPRERSPGGRPGQAGDGWTVGEGWPGVTQSHRQRWRFPPTTASVAAARNAVAELVAQHHPALGDDVRIVVSELASNAVLHAGTPYDLLVQVSDDRVRIEVSDTAPALPAVRYPALEATSGRGLHLITALCGDWGVEQRGAGKVVWVEFAAR